MSNAVLPNRLARVNQAVSERLDRIGGMMPQPKMPKAQIPFEEYLPRAMARAEADPDFAERFKAAYSQYSRAAGG